MLTDSNQTITAVPGIRVGHGTVEGGGSGCTVLLGPFRGACDVRGLATGTRELEPLSPSHLVPQIDGLMITGGSAFGLAAADGVVSWIAEQGGGFDAGITKVPIVPGAVIFDLAPDRRRPDARVGYAACVAATDAAVVEGRAGAGAGATVGKMRGLEHSEHGGIGTYAMRAGGYTIGALACVNALGDVIDFDGRIVAGARADDGSYIDTLRTLAQMNVQDGVFPRASNTTIAVVATDAPLTRGALQNFARAAQCAIVRRIAPANTQFDGDVVFAVSTSKNAKEMDAPELLMLGSVAQLALEHAILRAVRRA